MIGFCATRRCFATFAAAVMAFRGLAQARVVKLVCDSQTVVTECVENDEHRCWDSVGVSDDWTSVAAC